MKMESVKSQMNHVCGEIYDVDSLTKKEVTTYGLNIC